MFKKFLKDTSGNYAIAGAVALVPIMGAVGLGVDYAQLTRHKAAAVSALEASGIAVGRRVTEGADDEALKAYGKAFFEANLGPVDPANTVYKMYMPDTEEGNGNIKLIAEMNYMNSPEFSRHPRFSFPAFVRTRRATASRFSRACASGCRTSRCSRTHPAAPRRGSCRSGAVSAPA